MRAGTYPARGYATLELSGLELSFTGACARLPQLARNDFQRTASLQRAAQINLNTATAAELEKLPGIGRTLAGRIIEHREKFGAFRKPEHLIIVRGLSDKRFRALQDLITVE